MSMFQAQSSVNPNDHARASAVYPDHEFQDRIPSYAIDQPSSEGARNASHEAVLGTMLTPGTSITTSNAASPTDLSNHSHDLSEADAEDCLQMFRRQHLEYLSIMYLPPEMSAEQLLQQRPFLWLCIMAASAKRVSQQRSLNERIKTEVAQRLIHNFECSIDLLLELLVVIGW